MKKNMWQILTGIMAASLVAMVIISGCGKGGNGNVWADPVMIFQNGSSLRLAWDRVTTDIEGNQTYIDFYEVYYRPHGTTEWTLYDTCPDIEDPWLEVYHNRVGDGYWDFGVLAVDMEDQDSTMHSSLDQNAVPAGGWYILWKISGGPPPAQASGLRIISS